MACPTTSAYRTTDPTPVLISISNVRPSKPTGLSHGVAAAFVENAFDSELSDDSFAHTVNDFEAVAGRLQGTEIVASFRDSSVQINDREMAAPLL